MASIFSDLPAVRYVGPDSDAFGYRWYEPQRPVMGKSMAEQLRIAVCYWHTFCWPGGDPFGGDTFERPWFGAGDPVARAELKLEAAFDLFERLGTPFFSFHDRDLAPELDTLAASNAALDRLADKAAQAMQRTGVKLLWGTANLFSHRRYMAGAATNPDPEVFAYAAAQVRHALETTHRLGGANYVLWGGREGYETLLNTDMGRETEQLGRFLNLVVAHKHTIGFEGQILLEPKPREPTKHQYDFDVATVYAFLQRHGLEHEVKVNIEGNHATLAGHSFEHEIVYALAAGIFGSLDINRGDTLIGWDTDQFPNDVAEMALAWRHILLAGGLGRGGCNFDAKIRRQSIDPQDVVEAHVQGIDTLARGLLVAEKMIEDGRLCGALAERYAGWESAFGKRIMAGGASLAEIADGALASGLDPKPRSGRQERFEALVQRYV